MTKGHPIGTRVVFVAVEDPRFIGALATVISEPARCVDDDTGEEWVGQDVDVDDIPPEGGVPWACPPSWLEPLRDDGHEKVSWDELPEWARKEMAGA